MCGISALITLDGAGVTEADLRAMTATVRHRGPDDVGFALFCDDGEPTLFGGADTPESVLAASFPYSPAAQDTAPGHGPVRIALGHRRLSILDLSPAGHQPMCTPNRRYWIVYNGEVYNYRELRAELEGMGHTFSTGTDTEVLLHAYAEWGRDCLDRFNGMFAFVIFDRETGTIFAARDRFGVKPLYYWFSPEGFLAFASEIKQFTVLSGWEARLNHQRAFDFLAYGLIDHTNETLFDGVFQFRGGEAVETIPDATRQLPLYRYYSLDPKRSTSSFADVSDQFRTLFTDSVRLRLRADVPIGSCLSGGLDSSSIVCVVNQFLEADGKGGIQKTFSACSEIPRYDERKHIDEVVRGREIEAHYDYPSLDRFFSDLDTIIWHQDEPIVSTSMYAQWNVFRLASECGVKVMLDGQGADEQLCGYHSFFPVRYADLLRRGSWRRCLHEMQKAEAVYGYPAKQAALETAFFLFPDWLRRLVQRRRFSEMLWPRWVDRDVLGACETIENSVPATHTVDDLSRIQLFYTSLPGLLHWEDRNSMAHSIESRVPFLDYRLVEFVTGLPTDFKLRSCETKRVLREGMRGILPESIRARQDKMGFVTAEEEWATSSASERIRELVVRTVEDSQGVLTPTAIEYFDELVAGKRPYSTEIWRWIGFTRWTRIFNVSP